LASTAAYGKLSFMARHPRSAPGGYVYHVLNRAAGGGRKLFGKAADYAAFERIVAETQPRVPGVRLLAYCLMPTHWHLVLWPRAAGELSQFVRLLTVTHAQRLHAHRHTAGTGPIYQGRFKSFPVEADDRHLLLVCRYVERNPLRAKLVARAEAWPWGSLHRRAAAAGTAGTAGAAGGRAAAAAAAGARSGAVRGAATGASTGTVGAEIVLSPWPVTMPRQWLELVNRPMSGREERAMAVSIGRGRPLGSERWTATTVSRLGLQWTIRPRGRPITREKDSRAR
jgi:putative transposase